MSLVLTVLVLAIAWMAITGNFTLLSLLLGLAVALLALGLLRDRVQGPRIWMRAGRVLRLAGLFIRELVLSGVKVAWLVVQPDLRRRLRPGIIAFPLTARSDAEITLLANLITLTPGTLSVDVADDRKVLYIHVLALADKQALIAEIAGGFEARVIEVFQ